MSDISMAGYLFHQGTNFYAYDFLGCSVESIDGGYCYTFRTWAPGALSVGLISDFSGWDVAIPFEKITEKGIWELKYTSDRSLELMAYKFRITSKSGTVNKGDPYAVYSRGADDGASVIFTAKDYKWGDKRWLSNRKNTVTHNGKSYIPAPINIYEMHFASFARHEDGSYYTYREMAKILPSYLKRMGYTHVEFLPLAEYPYDGSWGYQVCAFYAVTCRFGTPDDFKYLVDTLHRAGIGVILDWVPAHFPKDEWGLYNFDGNPLYEYQGIDRQESRSWGTRFFDLGREEIQSFLISNALYYLREFHVDGLRVDAVASMIYLDFDRMPGEWIPAPDGTNKNYEAIAFLKKLNLAIFKEFSDVLMIAEESTAFGGITHPVSEGGLGFNLKWNMGFANDFYDYLRLDPLYRKYKHSALNFPLTYAFSENYCLPISHDEVVHGKKSFIDKMFGSYDNKFLQARCALMLIMTYPGKKLMFMGTEYAQFREWNFADSLEWCMLDYPNHRYFRDYVSALNNFYLASPPLWERDFIQEGFEWILPDESSKNVVVYKRIDNSGNYLISAINFSGELQTVKARTDKGASLCAVFDTGNIDEIYKRVPISENEGEFLASIVLPAFSGIIFELKKEEIIIKIRGEKQCTVKKNV